MARTAEIERLCGIERPKRGASWGIALVAALSGEQITICEPQIEQGPDGFPYLGVALSEGDSTASLEDILHHCTEQAHCGLAVFPGAMRDGDPEWVFSLGDLWSVRMFGSIEGDPADIAESGPETPAVAETEEIILAAPSDSFLPAPMKEALGNFLKDILDLPEDPEITLVVAPNLKPTRNLLLNIKDTAFRDAAHQEAVLNASGWFLPRHRGLVLWPEEWGDETSPGAA